MLRKTFFWLHLGTGLTAGAIVFIMSVTGVLLTYERQILAWSDRDLRSLPPEGAPRLPLTTLLSHALDSGEGELPASITVRSDPEAPVSISLGRNRSLFMSPYTGESLGEGNQRVRKFFRTVTDWHRWLGASVESRPTGKAFTGAANLAFLFLVGSGFYLWWPRSFKWTSLRNVIFFRRGLAGKARDFNWHNTIGFWSAAPLFVIVISGVVISYPWASDLLYRATGSEPPARRTAPPRAAGNAAPPPAPDFRGLDEGLRVA
ncbi:MAG TPA: PepSY-associated TM helix domain-containing protein, partial [Vicinamibacteria bacterium]|nr:PepSY-associated TM helix domain-containing protein [Vicinamibacteria bacterium]